MRRGEGQFLSWDTHFGSIFLGAQIKRRVTKKTYTEYSQDRFIFYDFKPVPTKQIGLYGYHHPNYFSLLVPDLGVSLHFCDYIFVWKVFDFLLNFLFIRKEGHLDLWIDYTFSSI